MNGSHRRSLHRHTLIASALVGLLLTALPLAADVCEVAPGSDPMTLRGQRIPNYEVFETFLLHASIVYDTQGPDAYRSFLGEYGVDPDLTTLQALPWFFDELQPSLLHASAASEQQKAVRVGEVLAKLLSEIGNDPASEQPDRTFLLRLMTQLRPTMSWVFIDENPIFQAIDEAEERFHETLGDPARIDDAGGKHGSEAEPAPTLPSGAQIKLSFLGHDHEPAAHRNDEEPVRLAEIEWRRYAKRDGSTRLVGVIDDGSDRLAIVDMSFRSGEHLRPAFKEAGVDGLLRFTEGFLVDEGIWEKSHTSFGCIAKSAAAAAVCAACATPEPTRLTCAACAAALAVAIDACNDPHCDQIVCNAGCVNACHQYGWCSSTSGSSSPADCQCFGQRFDIPQCAPPGPGCSALVSEVSMLDLDGGEPISLPSEPVSLRRLETSAVFHDGQQVSYLMGEWAVLAHGAPILATKSTPSVRALRSSSTEFAAAQSEALLRVTPASLGSAVTGERITLVVAAPPHEENSREIPLPALEIAPVDLPTDTPRGKIAIRADFSEAGELQELEILHDTLGSLPPQLVARIEDAISIKRLSDKEHRVVAFAVLSVGESLELESKLLYLPKCCCGIEFCA